MKKNLRHKLNLTLSIITFGLLTTSCTSTDTMYPHFYEFKGAEWYQNDTLFFEVDSSSFEINVPYRLTVEISNNVSYLYKNAWISTHHDITNDSVFISLSKEFMLADEFGKWTGSGFGTLYQSSFVLEENVLFKDKRNYLIKIEHKMQDEPLKGIEKVGVKLSKK